MTIAILAKSKLEITMVHLNTSSSRLKLSQLIRKASQKLKNKPMQLLVVLTWFLLMKLLIYLMNLDRSSNHPKFCHLVYGAVQDVNIKTTKQSRLMYAEIQAAKRLDHD